MKNVFKWSVLTVGGLIGVAHIGVLGHIMNASNQTMREIAMRPQYPSINLPTGKYSSYEVDVNRDGYNLRYNANDPKVLERTQTLELDKNHNNSGWFGKKSEGRIQKDTFVQEQYTMDGFRNLGGSVPVVVGEEEKKLSAADVACIKAEGAGQSTGGMVGASMTAGLAPVLTGIPYIGWLAAGWATLLGQNVGSELGGEVATSFSDC